MLTNTEKLHTESWVFTFIINIIIIFLLLLVVVAVVVVVEEANLFY